MLLVIYKIIQHLWKMHLFTINHIFYMLTPQNVYIWMDWTENDPIKTVWDASFEAGKMPLMAIFESPTGWTRRGLQWVNFNWGWSSLFRIFLKGETPKSRVFYPGAGSVSENAGNHTCLMSIIMIQICRARITYVYNTMEAIASSPQCPLT